MNLELINTGTELLLSDVVNTHLAWIGQRLSEIGLPLTRQVTVPDGEILRNEIFDAQSRKSIIICTGGLGPTSDDVTREITAEFFQKKLILDETQLTILQDLFASRGKIPSPNNLRQLMVPEGAVILPNPHGTAPGLYFPAEPGRLPVFLLPGPPRELLPMWTNHVEPELLRLRGGSSLAIRRLRVTGPAESDIDQLLSPGLTQIPDLLHGFCLGNSDVEIRLQGPQTATNAGIAHCQNILGISIYTLLDEKLEHVVVRLLQERKSQIALAESCTGGLIASRLTSVPSASGVFGFGWVTYANSAKISQLQVKAGTLETFGAVSAETALEMALGALTQSQANFALSVTGIAGPDGGSAEKPVGTVWIGLADRNGTVSTESYFFPYAREQFRQVVSQVALDKIRRKLLEPIG